METIKVILEAKGRAVHTVSPEHSVLRAVDEMGRRQVGALLVTDEGTTLGIVSERDVMRRVVLLRRDPALTKVQDVMSHDVVCVDEDASIEEAMAVMTERRIRHLPVVHDSSVTGMVSIGDLVQWVSQHQAFEIRVLTDYVTGRYPG
jgi:CBS domain-containing protein